MIRLDSRKIISWLLIFVPVILLILQQVNGLFAFRAGTYDSTIFTLICGGCMVAGYVYQERNPRDQLKKGIISALLFIGIPLIVGGVFTLNDATNGTTLTEGTGYLFALDTIGSQITEWTVVLKFITSIIPASVVVAGIIFIYMADTPDETQTAVIETALAIGLMILATLGLGWLGVSVF